MTRLGWKAAGHPTRDDVDAAQGAVRALLAALGEDVDREGLRETPMRVVKFLSGLMNPEPFKMTTFDAEGTSEMIVQAGIPFSSLCEHHMLPFTGTAVVAYIPAGRIVGLSKLARAVQFCASGLKNQERVTRAVADLLTAELEPVGVGVLLRARHSCMEIRGVKAHDAWTTTSDLRGAIFDKPEARAEFLALAREGGR
ncbi:MAG: GTP cyclohydrolase I [Pseudomonadota bacterium]